MYGISTVGKHGKHGGFTLPEELRNKHICFGFRVKWDGLNSVI
jgi:hypothetical protein